MWLVSTNVTKLKNFLVDGSKVELLEEPVDETTADEDSPAQFQVVVESRDSSVKPGGAQKAVAARPQDSVPDAERRIPPAWKTVDRVLDLLLWRPQKKSSKKGKVAKGKGKARSRIESDEDGSVSGEDEISKERTAALDDGEEPSSVFTESLEQWEERNKKKFAIEHAEEVAWIFVKWDDLTYDEGRRRRSSFRCTVLIAHAATWDSPPRSDNPRYYPAFKTALSRFIASRKVFIPEGGKPAKHNREVQGYHRLRLENASELDLGQDPAFKLMDFQVCVSTTIGTYAQLSHRLTASTGFATTGGIVNSVSLQMRWVWYASLILYDHQLTYFSGENGSNRDFHWKSHWRVWSKAGFGRRSQLHDHQLGQRIRKMGSKSQSCAFLWRGEGSSSNQKVRAESC
jgi:hypothetical protein